MKYKKLEIAFGSLLAPVILDTTRSLTFTAAVSAFIQSPLGKTITLFTGIALAVKGLTAAVGLLSAAKTILIAKFAATSAGAIALAKS